jgi:beta-glucosidase
MVSGRFAKTPHRTGSRCTGERACSWISGGSKEIYITENGVPWPHEPDAEGVQPEVDGHENDSDRIVWTRAYLTQLQRATAEGIPIRGYFHWTLMDNCEWMTGKRPRFGLYHVDYATQERTPKLSASFFREVAAQNALL